MVRYPERARVKSVPTAAGQSVELTADMFNVLNLVNRRWGLFRTYGSHSGVGDAADAGILHDQAAWDLRADVTDSQRRPDLEGRLSRGLAELGMR